MKKFSFICFLIAAIACNTNNNTATKTETKNLPVDSSYISAVEEGKALFLTHCSTCHAVNNDLTGPALAGVESRWKQKELLYAFIKNSEQVIASDAYAKDVYNRWNKVNMTAFTWMKDQQIANILLYINSVTEQK